MRSLIKSMLVFVGFLCLMATSTLARSSLPACHGSDVSRWTNCFGSQSLTNGNKYDGEHQNGKFNGWGVYTTANGDKYVGQWRDGERNGPGIEYKADGSLHAAGNWSRGLFVNNFAIDYARYPFNHSYAQSSLPGCQGSDVSRWTDCFGFQTHSNGAKGVGEFKDGKLNGQGSFTLANGDKYVGEFKDYKRNGLGISYRFDGTVALSGNWLDGKLENSFSLDTNRFPFNPPTQTTAPIFPSTVERERLTTEVEVERKKRQELEQQVASNKERDRIAAELDTERRKRQELEAQLLIQPQPSQGVRRNAHALVIGNGAYPGSGRLDNPVNDANAISQKLRSMGFTVTTVTDANRQRLVQAMTQFRRTAAAADLSLLFYAGHGVQIFGTNYILPTDVDQSDPAQATIQGVSLNSVVENFLPGKTKLVFLDACRDNALQRTNDRSVSKGLAPISAAEGTLISYATKDGQTAADGVGSKNSPFTQALLEHLNDPQDIAVVLRKVREKVMKATGGKQQPWEYGSLTGGELVLSRIQGAR